MLDTEQAKARIQQLEDEFEAYKIEHIEKLQQRDEENLKMMNERNAIIELLIKENEALQTELDQLKNS